MQEVKHKSTSLRKMCNGSLVIVFLFLREDNERETNWTCTNLTLPLPQHYKFVSGILLGLLQQCFHYIIVCRKPYAVLHVNKLFLSSVGNTLNYMYEPVPFHIPHINQNELTSTASKSV